MNHALFSRVAVTAAVLVTGAACSSHAATHPATSPSTTTRAAAPVGPTTTTIPPNCVRRPDQTGPGPEFLVTARNTAYDRTCIQTRAGRVVLVFNNRDAGVGHSLTVEDPAGTKVISSGILTGPRVFSLSFQVTPGVYTYHCDVHPTLMHGVLVVT